MNWNPAVVRKWMQENIEKYSVRAVGNGPEFTRNTPMMETVGALAWALLKNHGIETRGAFTQYVVQTCGWAEKHVVAAADKIEAESKITPVQKLCEGCGEPLHSPHTRCNGTRPSPAEPPKRVIHVTIPEDTKATVIVKPSGEPAAESKKGPDPSKPINNIPHAPATHVNSLGVRVQSTRPFRDDVKGVMTKLATAEMLATTSLSIPDNIEEHRAIEEAIEAVALAWTNAFFVAAKAIDECTDAPIDLDAAPPPGAPGRVCSPEQFAIATRGVARVQTGAPALEIDTSKGPVTVTTPAAAPVTTGRVYQGMVDPQVKPPASDRAVPLFPGEPPLSPLVDALVERGCSVTLIDVAGWSVVKRDVARLWIEQPDTPRPDFLNQCSACARGEPYVRGREYLHTGNGTLCEEGKVPLEAMPEPVAPKTNPNIVRPGVPCAACGGTGYDPKETDKTRCDECEGSGRAKAPAVTPEDHAEVGAERKLPPPTDAPVPANGSAVAAEDAPKRRGRPKGSKNKPKEAAPAAAAENWDE